MMNLTERETFAQEIFVGKGLVYSLVWRMGSDESQGTVEEWGGFKQRWRGGGLSQGM